MSLEGQSFQFRTQCSLQKYALDLDCHPLRPRITYLVRGANLVGPPFLCVILSPDLSFVTLYLSRCWTHLQQRLEVLVSLGDEGGEHHQDPEALEIPEEWASS